MRKRLFIACLLVFICCENTKAWDLVHAVGGRSSALGNCSVALSDFWSCNNNPAGISSLNSISIGLSYENRFLLKELGYKNLGAVMPFKIGVISISASQFGYKHYNENIIALAYARDFGPYLKIGLKLDYVFIKFSGDYEKTRMPTFELGIQSEIIENLHLGAYIFNPIHAKIKNSHNDRIPIVMRLGLSYHLTDNFLITSEIEDNTENNFSFRFGMEYAVIKNFFIRGGLQLNAALLSFGIGYEHKYFDIDISAQMNQQLGTCLQCSMVFHFNKEKKS